MTTTIPREELAEAVKLTASITNDHSIQSFTKVWLLKNKLAAFNGHIGISVPMEGLPELGGVDGKAFTQLLDSLAEEDVDLDLNNDGHLNIECGKTKITFNLMGIDGYIDVATKRDKELCRMPISALEDFNLAAMLQMQELRGEPFPEFTAVNVHPGDGRLTLYTSDRTTIHRSYWFIEDMGGLNKPFFIPREYFKLLARVKKSIEEGDLIVTKSAVIAECDGVELYTKLMEIENPQDFPGAARKVWPNGKPNKKLFVGIPDGFKEAIARASTLATDKADAVTIDVIDGEMVIKFASPAGKFEDTIEFEGHPHRRGMRFAIPFIKRTIGHADRMFIAERALIMAGPLRFTAFIASRN